MNKKVIISLIVVAVAALAVGVYVYRDQLFPKMKPPTSAVNQAQADKPVEPADPTKYNFMDADFAKQMVIHNQQGMQLASLAREKSSSQAVIEIANKINQGLSTDTDQYIAWLNEWKEPYLDLKDFPQMDGHDMYPTHPGMATFTEISSLESLGGSEFDQRFLEMMIQHREGAEQMAKYQNLQFGKMIELKDSAIKRQAEEVQTMKQLQVKGE